MNSKEIFGFRKVKAGLMSVTLATAFFGFAQGVSADEQAVSNSEVKTPESGLGQLKENGPIDSAKKEIQASLKQATVAEDKAQVGDVLKVDASQTEVKLSKTEDAKKETAKAETTVTIKTTSKADAETKVADKPVVKVSEDTRIQQVDGSDVKITEKVVKTTTEELTKYTDSKTEKVSSKADVVFVIDRSGSMAPAFNGVTDNVASFVKGLAAKGVDVRLGLVAYENPTDTDYIDFNGSKFTKDVDAYIKALKNIRTLGFTEDSPTALSNVAKTYDWSNDANSKRFAVLITDESGDYLRPMSGKKTEAEMLQDLKAANVSVSVISPTRLKNDFSKLYTETNGRYLDMNEDYSKNLLTEVSGWIETTVNKDRYYKVVTDRYDVTYLVEAEKKELVASKQSTPVSYQAPCEYPVKTKHYKALPQTGNQESTGLLAMGLMTSLAGLGLALKGRKEN